MENIRMVSPGRNGMITNEYGKEERPPADWAFLRAGDAAVTRKVTDQGQYWKVQVKKGRRTISKGVWAPASVIKDAKKQVFELRNSPDYEKKRESALRSRRKKQEAYEKEFKSAVCGYLGFAECYREIEEMIADAVTAHAIPVGSGTVARTATIPLEERAAKAVIAWMRHQTTSYDNMQIPRIKGERRYVRKQLAARSLVLLENYKKGKAIVAGCPLLAAVSKIRRSTQGVEA